MKETKEEKTEQKQNGNKTEKTLSGTDAEKGVWEKAADTIAGDNKLMGSVLKLVLSYVFFLSSLKNIFQLHYQVMHNDHQNLY